MSLESDSRCESVCSASAHQKYRIFQTSFNRHIKELLVENYITFQVGENQNKRNHLRNLALKSLKIEF